MPKKNPFRSRELYNKGVRGMIASNRESKRLNSPSGILKNTIQGLPDAAKKVAGMASGILEGGSIGGLVGATKAASKAIGNKIPAFKKGGKVKKTGPAKVHKGERVLTKEQNKKFEKMKKKVFNIKSYGVNKK